EHMVEQLKLKQLSWEQIENLAVPDDATVDRYEALLAEKQAGIARIIASRSDAEKELAQLATRMVALDALGELPSLEALEQSRRRRDQGWALIRDAWLGEGADRDALAAYLGGDDLDVVYEKAVRLSDRIADDLRKEAARVTQNAELKNQKEAIEERLRNDAARQELLDKDWTAVQQEWRALWEGLNIEPLSPREMQGWLRGFIQLRQQIREAVIQRNQCAALEAARDAVRAEVCQHLELFNETFDATDTLPALLDRCRRKLAFLTERCGEKKSLQEKLEEVSAEHARLRLELEDARQELAEWFEDWKEAINPLGLPQEATPEEAQDMVQRIDELLQGLGEMQAIDARLAGMARDEDAFRAEVATLVERVGPDLGETESIEAAEELRRRMDRARKDHTLMTDCEKQLKASREQFESANAAKGAAEAALAAMCREAGCEDREGLQEAERRSIECRRLKERLNDLESELSRLTGTSEFDAFEAEADQIDKDDIPGLLAALGHEIAELDTELHECMERIGSIRGD
ncbi:MAG: hypothetical protein KJ052_10695, partial [Candidatus Hydrogenedentes bacterium]|nr:hypothetical protein [Candidatus Hydrogenedentota bacterium]